MGSYVRYGETAKLCCGDVIFDNYSTVLVSISRREMGWEEYLKEINVPDNGYAELNETNLKEVNRWIIKRSNRQLESERRAEVVVFHLETSQFKTPEFYVLSQVPRDISSCQKGVENRKLMISFQKTASTISGFSAENMYTYNHCWKRNK